jgi:hypothetical protein
MKNGQRLRITKTADGAVRLQLGPFAIHREHRATRLELGRLWFIRCASNRPSEFPGHPDIHGHPNVWMIMWRRRLPEWDREAVRALRAALKVLISIRKTDTGYRCTCVADLI